MNCKKAVVSPKRREAPFGSGPRVLYVLCKMLLRKKIPNLKAVP